MSGDGERVFTVQARRDRRRVRTQRAFAEAALRLFDEKGFAATTVEEIAEAADYSVSTFFRLFTKKEDVVFYDVPGKLDELRASFAQVESGTAWVTIRDTLVANAQEWDGLSDRLSLSRFQIFHREQALRARYLEYCLEWEDVFTDMITRDRPSTDGNDIDARIMAAGLISAYRVALRARVTVGGSLVEHLERALDRLERAPLSATEMPAGPTRAQRTDLSA
jgi:AcrR family transcriptional regulator